MKLIALPIRDFAVPSPRSGSLQSGSGFGRSEALGQEIHRRVQKKRAKSDPDYRPEVPVSGTFDRNGYRFLVEGRMDGLFLSDPPLIEEIKSGFSIDELAGRLARDPFGHPYSLQLLTYGYLYHRQNGILPKLSLHLVSSRSGKSRDMEIQLDLSLYGEWLERRIDELVREARIVGQQAARRRKLAEKFPFPFPEPRLGQLELIEAVKRGITAGRPMLIQAPTGMGKTVGVLFPVLKETLSRGERVVYVTPKNSQHSVAEDAMSRFQDEGARLRSLTITAKGKICFKGEPLCDAECCEYARDYYSKVEEQGIREILARKRGLKARVFRELGERFQVCPFELQFEAAEGCDMVICDYNYVFAPRSSAGRLTNAGIGQDGKPSLVIDEAHNLPARAMEHYSPSLSTIVLEGIRDELLKVDERFRREAEALLDECIRIVTSCSGRKDHGPMRIEAPLDSFMGQDGLLRAFLARYLESAEYLGRDDALLRLAFLWSEFTAVLELAADGEREEFFVTFHPHPGGGTMTVTCCDASAMLKERFGNYGLVVGFSATLKPFEYYAQLSGLDPEKVLTAEFQTPFPREHRKLLIIPQISTRYSRRERNYGKIADTVRRISAIRPGNYFVFLPSFDFLERVAELFVPPAGFTVLKQGRGMTASGVEALLGHLRSLETPTIVFAVQGGSLAEGVDYAGEMVIGAFVVGPPLPTFDLEREEMRGYYQRRYGKGFEYAYAIPAMARAVQAAGRVIRSESDRGLIVLMDDRFLDDKYSRAMPADWFEARVTELVSGSILKDVAEFWRQTDSETSTTLISQENPASSCQAR